MNGDVGPVLEPTGLAEDGLGFLAQPLLARAHDILGYIEQKVRHTSNSSRSRRAWQLASCASTAPVAPHHALAVSSGCGIIALANTTIRTGARTQTRGAVKLASDWATSITSLRFAIARITMSA